MEIKEVLPAPFAPIRIQRSPLFTSQFIESSIGLSAIKDRPLMSKILFIFFAFCDVCFIIKVFKNMKKENSGKKIIILASASPRRSSLLADANIDFEKFVPNVTEEDSNGNPIELVKLNSLIKARAAAKLNRGRIVLGSDTVVALDGVVYGKPKDLVEAKNMLSVLAGRTHSVYTGVAFVEISDSGEEKFSVDVEESKVQFRKLDSDAIDEYISKVNVLDKAGAYAAQECGSLIIESIEGNFDNVMGLPIKLVRSMLKDF